MKYFVEHKLPYESHIMGVCRILVRERPTNQPTKLVFRSTTPYSVAFITSALDLTLFILVEMVNHHTIGMSNAYANLFEH